MQFNQEIIDITEAIKQAIPTKQIYLFGSYAQGTDNKDSDYDFFVVIPDGSMRPIDAIKTARKAMIPINRKTPVDILADYKSSFDERRQYNTLEKKIFNEGVILYEQA